MRPSVKMVPDDPLWHRSHAFRGNNASDATPRPSSSVPAVWRASCSRASLAMPASVSRAFHSSQSSCGSIARPVGPDQTRSQSCHACPAAARSASWYSRCFRSAGTSSAGSGTARPRLPLGLVKSHPPFRCGHDAVQSGVAEARAFPLMLGAAGPAAGSLRGSALARLPVDRDQPGPPPVMHPALFRDGGQTYLFHGRIQTRCRTRRKSQATPILGAARG